MHEAGAAGKWGGPLPVCRSPGQLGWTSFAVPEESQQAPPGFLFLIHLHLYFSSSTSDDERSQVPQGSSCWQPVVPAWLPGAEWGWFSAL